MLHVLSGVECILLEKLFYAWDCQRQEQAKRKGKQITEEETEKLMGKSQDPDFRGMIMQEVSQKKSHNKLTPD